MDVVHEVGRYAVLGEIASGGMGSVHLGRLTGPGGFARAVAIKRLHPVYAKVPEFVSMLLDEARVAARIHHPNVVATHDLIVTDNNVHLVMDYVEGESLARIVDHLDRRDVRTPPAIVSAIMSSALRGLHAAHEATSDSGEPLGIVHRDVSPQNIMVSVDGVVRVVDFGIAKAAGRLAETRDRQVKGKLRYMSPEQARGKPVSRRADIYAAGVVLWELVTGEPLHPGTPNAVLERILFGSVPRPSSRGDHLPVEFDEIVAKATARSPEARYATAAEMACAIEGRVRPALHAEVSAWLEEVAGDALRERAALVAELEKRARCEDASTLTSEGAATAIGQSTGPSPTEPTAPCAAEALGFDSDHGPLGVSSEVVRAQQRPRTRSGVATLSAALMVVAVSAIAFYQPRSAIEPRAGAVVAAASGASAAPPAGSDVGLPPAPEATSEPHVAKDDAPSSKSRATIQRGASRAPKQRRADCSIPFKLDDAGRKIYRRECIGAAP